MNPKIYLSAPVTGFEREERLAIFGQWHEFFTKLGYEVFNPMDNGVALDAPWSDHMREDIRHLCECDVLVRIDTRLSRGVQLECDIARAIGMKIVSFDELIYTRLDNIDYLLTP